MDDSARRPARIGILGGSFNPIHRGHLLAADTFARRLMLDRVLLLPSAAPFYKRTQSIAYAHRLTMCVLACASSHVISVSDVEQMSPAGMYTCDVVTELRHHYEDAELFLLLGSDVASTMPRWKGITNILREVHLGIVLRSPFAAEALPQLLHSGKSLSFLADVMLPISSTMVREAVRQGLSLESMVPPGVARYIFAHHLYAVTPPMTATA